MSDNRERYIIELPDREPWHLDQDPMNSDETEIEIGRAKLTYGMFGTIANNLEFPRPIMDVLEEVYQVYGVDVDIVITKLRKHPISDDWQLIYTGKLDLKNRRIENNIFSCDYIQGGLRELLTSQQKEKFEVDRETDIKNRPITPLIKDTLDLKEGRKIFLLSRLTATDNFTAHSGIWRPNNYEPRSSYRPFPIVVVSNNDPLNIQSSYETVDIDKRFEPAPEAMFFATADRTRGRIKMNAKIKFTVGEFDPYRSRNEYFKVVLDRYDQNYQRIDREIIAEFNNNLFSYRDQTFSFSLEKIFSSQTGNEIKEGESFTLGVFVGGEFDGGLNLEPKSYFTLDFYDVDVSITWAEDSYFRPTSTKAITAFNLGKRLTEIITGKPAFKSNYLSQGKWKDLLFTCGFWLRNMQEQVNDDGENDERTLTINWDDYHNSLNALEPMSYGIVTEGAKEYIAYENRAYFFQPYVTIKLGQIDKITRTGAEELVFTSLRMGYQKGGNYERPLGLDESNVETNYTLPITKHENKYDAVSPSRADSYAVEDCRRKQAVDFPEEDTAYDKDNFMIHGKKTGEVRGRYDLYDLRLWQDNFEEAPTGIYSPESAFNLTMSPGNIKEDHAIWFNGASSKYPDKWLMYANTEGNVQLTTKYPGKTAIKENENRLIKNLKKPIHAYDWIEFDYPYSQQLHDQIMGKTKIRGEMVNNFYGQVEYINEDGIKERGYIFSVKIKKKNMKFKLLRAYGQ